MNNLYRGGYIDAVLPGVANGSVKPADWQAKVGYTRPFAGGRGSLTAGSLDESHPREDRGASHAVGTSGPAGFLGHAKHRGHPA